MAQDGTAGRDAYLAAQQKGHQSQQDAAMRLLAMTNRGVGMTGARQDARFAFEAGAYSNPAVAEAKTAGGQWDDQVGYERLAIGKLMGDTDEQIADARRESEIGVSLNTERSHLDARLQAERDARSADLNQQRIAADRAAADAQAAATATQFNPQAAWDAITRNGKKPPGPGLLDNIWGG